MPVERIDHTAAEWEAWRDTDQWKVSPAAQLADPHSLPHKYAVAGVPWILPDQEAIALLIAAAPVLLRFSRLASGSDHPVLAESEEGQQIVKLIAAIDKAKP